MSQKPDPTKIDVALKRAAHKAIHGSREERSGRFFLKHNQRGKEAASKPATPSDRTKRTSS